jgi:beta-aspartyl-dipeptidase (metallo-type)
MALEAVLPALTATPAAIWGLPRKGRLAVGADADLLLLSPRTFAIEAVIADGRLRLGG